MGLLEDAYAWVDRNLAGGALPGGFTGGLGVPGAGLIERVAGQFAPGPQLPSGFVEPVPQGGIFAGGGAQQAANGMPVSFGARPVMPRGKTITATATMMPDGTIIPGKIVPGRALVTTADLATVKRVRKTKRKLDRAFPTPRKKRRSYRAPRRSSSKR